MWQDGVRCPRCGPSRLHRDGYTRKRAANHRCLNCGRYFNDLTNSVLAFVREVREIGEKREVEGHTRKINHQCRHLLFTEKSGKIRFFAKRNLSKDDTKETLKTVSESEIGVDTDEYSIYEGINELENVKEHRFVNHSEEYANNDVHVNIHHSVPDGLGGRVYKYLTKYDMKRLTEVDFTIFDVSEESANGKNLRYGHISTLHIWARRPLASPRD